MSTENQETDKSIEKKEETILNISKENKLLKIHACLDIIKDGINFLRGKAKG